MTVVDERPCPSPTAALATVPPQRRRARDLKSTASLSPTSRGVQAAGPSRACTTTRRGQPIAGRAGGRRRSCASRPRRPLVQSRKVSPSNTAQGDEGWGVWHSALGHGIPPSSRPIYPAEEGSGAKDEDEGRSSRRAAHPSEPQSVVRLQGALATSFGREPTRDDEAGCKGPAMCTRRHGDSAAPGPREGSEPPRPAKRHRAVWHGVCVARAGGQACEHRRHRCLIRELRRPALQYAPMHTASRVCRALAGC